MSLLLLIRSLDDVRSAVEQTSEFLRFRRKHFLEASQSDEILGIWLRRELDADLPAWLLSDGEHGAGVQTSGGANEEALEHLPPAEAFLAVRETVSLSGLWALCWIRGSLLLEAIGPRERRRRILDALLRKTTSEAIIQPGAFFPVFEATEPFDSIHATWRELRVAHPNIIAETWFVDDRERGLLGPRDGR